MKIRESLESGKQKVSFYKIKNDEWLEKIDIQYFLTRIIQNINNQTFHSSKRLTGKNSTIYLCL